MKKKKVVKKKFKEVAKRKFTTVFKPTHFPVSVVSNDFMFEQSLRESDRKALLT